MAVYEKGINLYEINFGVFERNASCILLNNSAQKVKRYAEQKLEENCSYFTNSQENEANNQNLSAFSLKTFDNCKQEKILKLFRAKYDEAKYVSAAVDEVNYEFDFNVIKEKAHNLNKVINPQQLRYLYERNLNESNLVNYPEINLINPSMITNENKNPESNQVTNIHDNDDFFDGLDDYLESNMGVNIDDNRAKSKH
uniref:Uncharacterized protein n=1 Tax=Meloidogyne floridensis TaxID=298350 RepID=A0A915NMA8_9BILA